MDTLKIQNYNHLPTGWTITTLGEVCLLNPRSFLKPVKDDQLVSFVPMAEVEAGTGRMCSSRERTYGVVKSGYTRFSEGDVLLAKITPSMENGKVAIAKGLRNEAGCGSTEFHVLRPMRGMSNLFVMYFLLQEDFRQEARRHMAGTAGQLRVPASFLQEATLPIPPFPEQRRIVAEIEKQFTRLDASVASLERVRANLRRYRTSVLKAACEGSLVATEAEFARAEGRPYEHADELLERILKERREKWESQQTDRGIYRDAVAPHVSELPSLPEGWVWSNVGQLAAVSTGSTPLTSRREFYQHGTVPWLTSSALNNSVISAPSKLVTEQAVRECRLSFYPPRTLLVAMYGEGKTRGKCSEMLISSTINQAIAAIVMDESAASCQAYTKVFLDSNYEATRSLSSGGVQPNLNLGLIRKIEVPLPPVAEQERIASEVQRRLSIIRNVESAVDASLDLAERLRQSILKQAFCGRIVLQDPGDEPASVLLEGIHAERAKARAGTEANRKRGRRTRRNARAVS